MKLLRDPLVIFLLIGGGIFLVYALVSPEAPDTEADPYRVEITEETLEVLKDEWSARKRQPPTTEEFDQLVDEYVKEEILFREATRLGLEKSDSVIRRRLAEKMEFLTSDVATAEEVSAETLEAYYQEHADAYRLEGEIGFEHLFFSPEKRADAAKDATTTLSSLKDGTLTFEDALKTSDQTRTSPTFSATAPSLIRSMFGDSFVEGITNESPGSWFGPISSKDGIHLVRLTQKNPAALPPLNSIAEKVLSDYHYDQRTQLNKQMLDELLQQYEVIIGEPKTESDPS